MDIRAHWPGTRDDGEIPLDTVVNADCIEGMASLPEGCVDVIVTSPPYNIGKEYRAYNDNRPRREFLTWLGSVFSECDRVLAEDGSFFLNVGGKPSDPWIPLDIAAKAREHFHLQNVIHWVKSIAIPRDSVGKACGIEQDLATCEAVLALVADWHCSGPNGMCGPFQQPEVPVPGALCDPVGGFGDRCTYACGSTQECLLSGPASSCGTGTAVPPGWCGG